MRQRFFWSWNYVDQEFRREKNLNWKVLTGCIFYPNVKTEMVIFSTDVKRGHYRYQNSFTVGEWIHGIAGPNGAVKMTKKYRKERRVGRIDGRYGRIDGRTNGIRFKQSNLDLVNSSSILPPFIASYICTCFDIQITKTKERIWLSRFVRAKSHNQRTRIERIVCERENQTYRVEAHIWRV